MSQSRNQAVGTKDHASYDVQKQLTDAEASGAFSHPVTINIKLKSGKTTVWYVKKIEDPLLAQREVIAQELFRFFNPGQPKTRLLVDDKGRTYVASKALEGCLNVESAAPAAVINGINSQEFIGLGDICIFALLLNERDFKTGNLVLVPTSDPNKWRFVKLDGDWCFAVLREPNKNYAITPKIIQQLPDHGTYEAYNWLDVTFARLQFAYGDVSDPTVKGIINPDMASQPNIRQEINAAALRALLMPDELYRDFIAHYTTGKNEIEKMVNTLINRKAQLYDAMMQDKDFKAYMGSQAAIEQRQVFMKHLQGFTLTHKTKLLNDSNKSIILDKVNNQFARLHLIASQSISKTTLALYDVIQSSGDNMVALAREKQLLAQGADSRIIDVDGNTLVHLAAPKGKLELVAILLDQVDINQQNNQGDTALHLTANKDDSESSAIFSLLLASGANPDLKNNKEETALHIATKSNNLSAVFSLLEVNADPTVPNQLGSLPIHIAAKSGNAHLVAQLLTINAAKQLIAMDQDGEPPLLIAIREGHIAIVNVLLRAGADVNQCNHYDDSALYEAIRARHSEIAEMLLEKGANPILQGAYQHESPLACAIRTKNWDIAVKMLVHINESQSIPQPMLSQLNQHQVELKDAWQKILATSGSESSYHPLTAKPNALFEIFQHAQQPGMPATDTASIAKALAKASSSEGRIIFNAPKDASSQTVIKNDPPKPVTHHQDSIKSDELAKSEQLPTIKRARSRP